MINPYHLKTLNDFYALHTDIQKYLKEYFLEPDYQILIKTTAGETIEALTKDWEYVEDFSLRSDQEHGLEHEPLSPSIEAQETVTGILKLFNSALAILFRSDWEPYQEALFDSWIPIGVERPSSEQDVIQVLNWPAGCFEKNTYTCTSDTLKVLESGLTLCTESGDYVLFWKPESYPVIPLDRLAKFSPYDTCTLNLWEDDQLKTPWKLAASTAKEKPGQSPQTPTGQGFQSTYATKFCLRKSHKSSSRPNRLRF